MNRKYKYIQVGFWNNLSGTQAGRDEIKSHKGKVSPNELRAMLAYIASAEQGRAQKGTALCRVCEERLGSCDMYTIDNKFTFPRYYEHYIIEHSVRPPENFIQAASSFYARNKNNDRRRKNKF